MSSRGSTKSTLTMTHFNFSASVLPFVFHLILTSFIPAEGSGDYGECVDPLGMENGLIKDEDISSSSSHSLISVGPQFGRLNNETSGGAWCPSSSYNRFQSEEWLQIDLRQVYKITSVAIQGRNGNEQGNEYSNKISLKYYRPELGKLVLYKTRTGDSSLPGNNDTKTTVMIPLDHPIYASKIRILPYSNISTICLRVELYGCLPDNSLVTYMVPQGDAPYKDWTYDGDETENLLTGGLGQLVDGETQDGLVGWSRDILNLDHFNITFKFHSVKGFQAVQVYFKEVTTLSNQISCRFIVFLSTDGSVYLQAAEYENTLDETTLGPGHVRVKLRFHIGQYLKIQFYFLESPWIFISEIGFESQYMSPLGEYLYDTANNKKENDTTMNREKLGTSWWEQNSTLLKVIGVVLCAVLFIVVIWVICLQSQNSSVMNDEHDNDSDNGILRNRNRTIATYASEVRWSVLQINDFQN